jgi:hypothetical protein
MKKIIAVSMKNCYLARACNSFSLVLVTVFCLGVSLNAQKVSDLDPSIVQGVIDLIHAEVVELREEFQNAPPGVNVETVPEIVSFYYAAQREFLNGDLTLSEAFSNNVAHLLGSELTPLVENLFDFPSNSNQFGIGNSTPGVTDDMVSFNNVTSSFEAMINSVEINGTDFSSLRNLFQYIRNNR